jgi:hypothetical protein
VSVPSEPVPIPEIVDRIAAGRQIYPAWANEDRLDYYLALWNAGDISSH